MDMSGTVSQSDSPNSSTAAIPHDAVSPPGATRPPHVTGPPEATRPPHVTGPPEATRPPHVTGPPETTRPPHVTGPPEATRPPHGTGPPEATSPPHVTGPPEATRPPQVTGPPEATRLQTTSNIFVSDAAAVPVINVKQHEIILQVHRHKYTTNEDKEKTKLDFPCDEGQANIGFVPDGNHLANGHANRQSQYRSEDSSTNDPQTGKIGETSDLFFDDSQQNDTDDKISEDKPYTINYMHQNGDNSSEFERSRASSKVSFSDETKISIFKRMDSIPMYKTNFIKRVTSLRWRMAFMCCAVASFSITVRQCMSMAIVCMSEQTASGRTNTSQNNGTDGEFKDQVQWDDQTEGLVLSAYYYTFPLSPVLVGYLAGKFGGKHVVLAQILLMCAASALIPSMALVDSAIVMVLRAIVGFASGGLMPAIGQLLSKWAPRLERSQMMSIVNSGQSIGNILTFMFSGVICMIPIQGGWPFIFYIFSAINFLCIIVWAIVVYDSPEVHPKADIQEITYILQERRSSTAKMPSPPWVKIVTSGPFWAILAAHTAHGFIYTLIGTFLPLYMQDVLLFDTTSNGLLSSLPFIGRFLGSIAVGVLADKCLEKRWTSTGVTRKILQCVGMIGSAPFLIGLSFLTADDRTLAVVLLVCYWTIQSTTNAAFRVNHLDIAPTYAGIINGFTLTCGSLAALVAPLLTSVIITEGTREEWQIVFLICVGVGCVGAILFCVLGSGEEQAWAVDPNLDIDGDIRRLSVELQQNKSDDSNGTVSSGFSLGGNRRKSSQKTLSNVSSDASMKSNPEVMDDIGREYVDNDQHSVELSAEHYENDKEVNSVDKDEHIEIKLTPPPSPSFSYKSYGFENTTFQSDDDIGEVTMDDYSSQHRTTCDCPGRDVISLKNRNHKQLSLIITTVNKFTETTSI